MRKMSLEESLSDAFLSLFLRLDAQLSRCSWPTDKWEKIVQFEAVVSSRRAALQINERLPQVWQEIFPSIPGRAVRSAASPPSLLRSDRLDTAAEVTLRRRRRSGRAPYFYSPPLADAASSPLACFFDPPPSTNPHLKRQSVGFGIVKFPFPHCLSEGSSGSGETQGEAVGGVWFVKTWLEMLF